jgi:hypothetical protein
VTVIPRESDFREAQVDLEVTSDAVGGLARS